jgi:predicted amidohydrolase
MFSKRFYFCIRQSGKPVDFRNHEIAVRDLWVRRGKIIDPEPLFYVDRRNFDREFDCQGAIIAPGLIDLQGCVAYTFPK